MIERTLALWSLWIVLCSGTSFAQSPRSDASAPRRALLVSNVKYSKLAPLPAAGGRVKALERSLRSARFEVEVQTDLDFDALITTFDRFQSGAKPGEVDFLYYSGYAVQDLDTYFVPVDFDPAATGDLENRGYLLERGLAAKGPSLSMLLIDSVWASEEAPGAAALNQPPASHSWIFASFEPKNGGHPGQFTDAFVTAISVPGLDLTDISDKVIREIAPPGGPQPKVWSTDPPRFYFQDPIGVTKVNGKDRLKYVKIPSGLFWMGCAPGSEARCKAEEKPRHQVEIGKGYWLGQTEVTNLAYQRFNPHWKPTKHITDAGKENDLPVVDISWQDAENYCERAAPGGRLPTEAEWERAARGGKDDEIYPFPDLKTSREKANFHGVSGNDKFVDIAPVEQFDPNGYQLYDMAGNVWEWVHDWFSPTYYAEISTVPPARDPAGPAPSDKIKGHVVRGGSYDSDPKLHLRLSYRESKDPGNNVGFRCLLPDTPGVLAGFRN